MRTDPIIPDEDLDVPSPGPRRGRKRGALPGEDTLSAQLRAIINRWIEVSRKPRKGARPTRPLTVAGIAAAADIDHRVLGRFLRGGEGITMATAERIADAFDVRLEDESKPDTRSAVVAEALESRKKGRETDEGAKGRGRKAKGETARKRED